MDFDDLITKDVPTKTHYTVVELSDGKAYTIEADSTEELYQKAKELQQRAEKQGLKIVQ